MQPNISELLCSSSDYIVLFILYKITNDYFVSQIDFKLFTLDQLTSSNLMSTVKEKNKKPRELW